MSLSTLCQGLCLGKKDIHSYIDETLSSITEKEPSILALLPEPDRYTRLHQAAAELYARYPEPKSRPPLFGVLFGVKDLFNVDGLATQAGSQLPPEAFRGAEAEVVTKLKELGAIVLGKTVSTEFAYFSPGPTRNPLNPAHTPGGSSSGSAAAVAADYCSFALGTQTIASIIRPASYCGVYGFKPSFGLISSNGVFPFSQTADHVGIIADSLSTISFLAQSLGCLPKATPMPPEPGLGWVRGEYLEQAGESARKSWEEAIKRLKNRGFRLIELDPFGDIDKINNAHRRLIAAEFALNHKELFARYGKLYSKHSTELIQLGSEVPAEELNSLKTDALSLRTKLHDLMAEKGIALFLAPSTTTPAPKGLESTGSPLMSLPWTNAGLPSLTIPAGFAEDGLPLGLQLVGAFNSDYGLLEAAVNIEAALHDQA